MVNQYDVGEDCLVEFWNELGNVHDGKIFYKKGSHTYDPGQNLDGFDVVCFIFVFCFSLDINFQVLWLL